MIKISYVYSVVNDIPATETELLRIFYKAYLSYQGKVLFDCPLEFDTNGQIIEYFDKKLNNGSLFDDVIDILSKKPNLTEEENDKLFSIIDIIDRSTKDNILLGCVSSMHSTPLKIKTIENPTRDQIEKLKDFYFSFSSNSISLRQYFISYGESEFLPYLSLNDPDLLNSLVKYISLHYGGFFDISTRKMKVEYIPKFFNIPGGYSKATDLFGIFCKFALKNEKALTALISDILISNRIFVRTHLLSKTTELERDISTFMNSNYITYRQYKLAFDDLLKDTTYEI